jgi:hypothetical protein
MSQEFVETQLKRCRALLRLERAEVELKETAPDRDPASLGALGGTGFEAKDPDVRVSVYVFEDWSKHREATEQLMRNMPKDDGVRILHSTNGPMLFFGYARIDGPKGREAKYRLSGIASAFAGDE